MIITEKNVALYINKMYSNFYEITKLPPRGMTVENWLKKSLSMNHYEHSVSFNTKKEVFGRIPNKDEMILIDKLIKRLTCSRANNDREFQRQVAEFSAFGLLKIEDLI